MVAIHAAERKAAKEAGERFYETSKPCKKGHIAKRYTGTGLCSICATEATKRVQAFKREPPSRTEARQRGDMHYSTEIPCKYGHNLRYVSSSQCVECSIERNRKWFAAHPGVEAEWARKRRAKDPVPHRQASKRWYHKKKGN